MFFFHSLRGLSLSNLLVTVRSQSTGTWSVIGVSAVAAYSTAPNDALGRLPRETSISSSHLSVVIIRIFPLWWTVHYLLATAQNRLKKKKSYFLNSSIVSFWALFFVILNYPSSISHCTALLFKLGQGPFHSQHCLFSVFRQWQTFKVHHRIAHNQWKHKSHCSCN